MNIREGSDSNESEKNPLVHSDERQRAKEKEIFFTVLINRCRKKGRIRKITILQPS